MSGRPRTAIGTYGTINVWHRRAKHYVAHTRFRDADGRLREVTASGHTRTHAVAELKTKLHERPGYGIGEGLGLRSPFTELAKLWLADLDARDLSEGTKDNYRKDLRTLVMPTFEHYTLGEVTTGRVESFLKEQAASSYSKAKLSRNLLNQLFGYALRQDAISRNPVEGTSPLKKPKGTPQALTLEQVQAIRQAAAVWRTGPDVKGPRPDGQVRDAIEVLLGTGMRPGEVLALRPVDLKETKAGMVAHVCGTVVERRGKGSFRQDHPKTDASNRSVPVPEFATAVLRARMEMMSADEQEWTIFHTKKGGPITVANFRRTFREFLALAGLAESGISPRWYRRTGATVVARALGADAAATHLGHTSTAITEGHYIEPDKTVDFAPAAVIERTLRPVEPDETLLKRASDDAEDDLLDALDNDAESEVETA